VPDQAAEDADSAQLIARIKAGDDELFAVVYERYFERVYGYMRLMVRTRADAEDATQDVFVRALAGLSGYEGRGESFRGWLFAIAHNVAFSELRRAQRVEAVADVNERYRCDAQATPDEAFANLQWVSDPDLQILIRRLSLAQRQVLFLRYVVGCDGSDVAQILGISPEAVWQHHSRAVAFLRKRLAEFRGGEDPAPAPVPVKRIPRIAPVLRSRRFSLLRNG
jgi:RNA polymerase sigma-70 factor (ECF subfamily)